MKKILSFGLLLSCALGLHGQTELEYDFAEQKFTQANGFKIPYKNKSVQIKVKNINQNLYRISVSSRDSTFPDEAFKMPWIPDMGLGEIKELLTTINKTLTEESGSLEHLKGYIGSTGGKASIGETPSKPEKSAEAPQPDKIRINNIIDQGFRTQENHRKNLYTLLEDAVEKNLSVRKKVISATSLKPSDPSGAITPGYLTTLMDDFNSIRKKIILERNAIDSEITQYVRSMAPEHKFVTPTPELRYKDSLLRENYNVLRTLASASADSLSVNNIYKIANGLQRYEWNKSGTYLSMPFVVHGDEVVIKMNFKPRDSLALPEYSAEYHIPVEKQWFTAISTGLFVSQLFDEEYSWETIPATSETPGQFMLRRESDDSWVPGVNVMLKRGYKATDNLGLSLGFGTGFSMGTTVRPRFLLGGGLAFGDKHLFMADVGIIAGQVDRLKSVYEEGKAYNQFHGNLLIPRFQRAVYLSAGYAFKIHDKD